MSRDSLDLLRDALAHARHALDNGEGLSAGTLAEAPQPLHAVLYNLAIIGESWGNVSQEVRSLAPGIPWRGAVGLRNHVVHAYWQIDFTIVADVLELRLPQLIADFDRLIAVMERQAP